MILLLNAMQFRDYTAGGVILNLSDCVCLICHFKQYLKVRHVKNC
jgi:hypothetical protein